MKTLLNKILSTILLLSITFSCTEEKKNHLLLPVMGSKQVVNNDTVYHKVGKFNFKNQFGEIVSERTVKDKIYIADFFFATCQSICPKMSEQMKLVQKAFEKDEDILILSHTVNPLHDTVEVLNQYGASYGAIKGKWHFLTGPKHEIYTLAKESYLVNAFEDDGTPEGFLHSELFLLIDKQGRIRGMYDGTDEVQVKQLIADIGTLKKEIAAIAENQK
ncbi:MAG: SCO family protein [Bacteroidia bacterium]